MLPSVRADLPQRLAGWGIAFAVAVPVALFVWPPRDQNVLRRRAAALCRALAAMLHLEQPPPGTGDPLVAMRGAARDLRAAFRTSATRTAAVSTGARLLIRLVDELEWLATAVTNACADAPGGWPESGRRLRETASQVLANCADSLEHDGAGPDLATCSSLDACIAELDRARSAVAESTLAELRASTAPADSRATASAGTAVATAAPGEFERPLYAAHELGYAVGLAARTVATIADADSRSWWARVRGRGVNLDRFGNVSAVQRLARGHFDRHSVWLHNSVRGAAGLAVAVLLSRVFDAQNAFWIGLGALSVLRSNALSTGATVLRALVGTALGFAAGGLVIAVLGTDRTVLWSVFPVVVFIAAVAPAVISFVAGQAAFTVFSIILFNIIAPIGWRVGVLRVEDVALGCAASLVAGALFWPRGAAAALAAAFAEAYHASAAYLQDALDSLTGLRSAAPQATGTVATAAGYRLDDALRQYLGEQGAKHVPLDSVAALANGATRLRIAGVAIGDLRDGEPVATDDDPRLAETAAFLDRRGRAVTDWYATLARTFEGPGAAAHSPSLDPTPDGTSFLEIVLPAVERCGHPDRAQRAERLLWAGQYVGDVDRLRQDLLEPATQIAAARARAWWRR